MRINLAVVTRAMDRHLDPGTQDLTVRDIHHLSTLRFAVEAELEQSHGGLFRTLRITQQDLDDLDPLQGNNLRRRLRVVVLG